MKKTLEEVRQANLKQLLDTQFSGDIEQLANTIHKGVSTVRKYLSPRLERKISSNIARTIERHLKLDPTYLDSEYHGNLSVYYVTLKVSRNFTYHVVERIEDYPEAVECSALLGEYDVLIKVEVPTYHDLQIFYDKLSRLPGVQRTRTYPAVGTIRWQRPQTAFSVLQDPNQFSNYAEAYKHQRILEYMEEIRKLEKGSVSSDGLLQNQVDLNTLMQQVKREYLAIRLHDEKYTNEAGYLAAERERIENGVIVKRIITLPKSFTDPMSHVHFEELLTKARELINVGSQVRFMFVEHWIASTKNKLPECFAVVDDEYVYLKKGHNHSQLMTLNDDVLNYRRAFTVNWNRAVTIDALTGNE